MQKRGYFFTIDVAIALVIIVVGFLLIWSTYLTEAARTQPYFLAQDAIDYLSSTQVAAVSGTIPYVQQLIFDGNITNFDSTLLEQIAIFYLRESRSPAKRYFAENFTRYVFSGIMPEQYGFEVTLNRTRIFMVNSSTDMQQNQSDLLISAKKIVVVVEGKTNLSLPYMAEVRVWR